MLRIAEGNAFQRWGAADWNPGGGGGHLGIFWVGMYRPGPRIGTPF